MNLQIIRFLIVGGLSTLVNYSIFYVLIMLGVQYLISSAIGFVCGILFGYPFNKKWTFDAAPLSHKYLFPYFLIYLLSLVISLIFLKITVSYFNIDPKIANILAIIITTITNFIGIKFGVFKK